MKQELRLYEYAIILQPKTDKNDKIVENGELVDSGTILALREEDVQIQVARKIPETHMEHLERVTLAVRPF